MKEVLNLKSAERHKKESDIKVGVAFNSFIAVIGFILSRANVLGKFLPFGISFVAAVPNLFTPAAALGAFLGYFFPAIENGAFKYLALLFAVIAIKLLLNGFKKLLESPLFLGAVCFAFCFFTGVSLGSGGQGVFLNAASEGLLCGIGAVVAAKTVKGLKRKVGLLSDETTCFVVFLNLCFISFHNKTVFGISLGFILGFLVILLSAKYGGIQLSSVAGIALAMGTSLSGVSAKVAVSVAFIGLACGVISTYGRFALSAAMLISGFCFCVALSAENVVFICGDILISITVFLLIPKPVSYYLSCLFSVSPRFSVPVGLKKSVSNRLLLASEALKDVSKTVERVSGELSKINTPDISHVISGVEDDACKNCKLRIHCFETKRAETLNAILEMTKAVKQNKIFTTESAPQEFKDRCVKIETVGNAVYKRYSEFAAKTAAENRIDEVRKVVTDQFGGMSSMLKDLSRDFSADEKYDNFYAEKAVSALKNIDIIISECCSKTDSFGRITIELKLNKSVNTVINKMQVMRLVSNACDREFDIPNISNVSGETFITLTEKPLLSIETGIAQSTANGGNLCGDAYNFFKDNRGHFLMVLSDGMGTGGRAAVDGAMASGLISRLIKSGFGFECSLNILNSSMIFKSTDESLATIDIASVDLFTGETKLLKAGAAPTLVRRGGKTGKAESSSLPVGILRGVHFDSADIKMKVGDIVLLMSDGALSDGTDWIRRELENFEDGTAADLAEHICEKAKRRQDENHQDDITVLVGILKKAV